jgi:uncharacterized tellurite resistance protein B-like protein
VSHLGEPWQVLSDCPHCFVEAAVLELMDPVHPACHLGVPAESRCRMCGWLVIADAAEFVPKLPVQAMRCPNCSRPLSDDDLEAHTCSSCEYAPNRTQEAQPADLTQPEAAISALNRWAQEEGEPDVHEFCSANMGAEPSKIVVLLANRQVVSTTFDVIAFLFPSAGGAGGQAEPLPLNPAEETVPETLNEPPQAADPRVPVRALVSVMAADGELRPGERTFIERFAAAEGIDAPSPEEIRVWRPHELPEPEHADKLVEAMVHLAHLDRQRDGSEWKVVVAFARSWGVSEDDVNRWDRMYDRRYANAMTMLWRTLSGFVRLH